MLIAVQCHKSIPCSPHTLWLAQSVFNCVWCQLCPVLHSMYIIFFYTAILGSTGLFRLHLFNLYLLPPFLYLVFACCACACILFFWIKSITFPPELIGHVVSQVCFGEKDQPSCAWFSRYLIVTGAWGYYMYFNVVFVNPLGHGLFCCQRL